MFGGLDASMDFDGMAWHAILAMQWHGMACQTMPCNAMIRLRPIFSVLFLLIFVDVDGCLCILGNVDGSWWILMDFD